MSVSKTPRPEPTPSFTEPARAELEQALQLFTAELLRARPSLLSWSMAFRVEDARPLDFSAFPFQRELYEAFGDRRLPTVDVMKSAQCGVSAAGVSLALYAADAWGAHVLYVLPTEDMAYAFSDTRVKPAIEDVAYLVSRVAHTDRKGLKRIGVANVYFVGSGSERQALSIPADVLILDEYDRLDRRQIPRFQRRLSAPTSLRLERRFSNPRFPEDGIHALYLASDQRAWLVSCPACRHEAPIAYDPSDGSHFLAEERAQRVCGRCKKPLREDTIAAGRWVPERPGIPRRGYHISRLIVPADDMALIAAKHRLTAEDEVQTHYNFDLGLPYAPRGGSLAREQVLACRRKYTMPESYEGGDWVTAGIDVGAVLHVRISRWMTSGRAAPLFIGEVPDFPDLLQLWRRFNVNFGLVDERPEERKAREFAGELGGQVMLLRWGGEDQRDDLVIDADRRLVIARRTWACDKTVDAFATQRRLLPREVPEAYLLQITALHRVTETNHRGQKIARYVSERANHYFFAETHDLLAHEVRGVKAAEGAGPPPPSIRDRARRSIWR